MNEGGLACLLCPLDLYFGGDRGADLGEGGRDVGRGVVEGGADETDGDEDELDASPILSEGAKEGVECTSLLLGLFGELVLAAEVTTKANLEEDEGEVLAVEGVGVRSGVQWQFSSVDVDRGGARSCRRQLAEVFLWKDPSRYVPGGRHTFFIISRCLPLDGESLCVYVRIDSAILAERKGRSGWCYRRLAIRCCVVAVRIGRIVRMGMGC